jgi:hypothetical protein
MTCRYCEHFDAEYGDCLSRNSDRFQTTANSASCPAFFDTAVSYAERAAEIEMMKEGES